MNQATTIPLQQTATFKLYERMAEVNAAITQLEAELLTTEFPMFTNCHLLYSDNLRDDYSEPFQTRAHQSDDEFWAQNATFCLILCEHYEQELSELKQKLHAANTIHKKLYNEQLVQKLMTPTI